MEFKDKLGAPPELVRIINEEAKLCNSVKCVVFDAFIPQLGGNLGAFEPKSGTIIIDMGTCITHQEWIKRGFTLTANAWINLLFTAYHEIVHAVQVDEEPELKELKELPIEYEAEAVRIAQEFVLNWTMDHPIPKLNEMGWVGEQIKDMLNRIYSMSPEVVIEELKLEGTNLAANALLTASTSPEFRSEEEIIKILTDIQLGIIGGKIDDKYYLTAYEAVGLY